MSESVEHVTENTAVKQEETKADKFVRLGENRVNRVMEAIGRIEHLANRGNYDYTPEQVEEMFTIMENRLAEVDRLFVDESHNYKNLFLYTKMRNVAGIAQTEAQKSSDMFAKCQYMDELTGGKGI